MISAYNSRGGRFFETNPVIESAFGSRLFSPGHQLTYVRKKLLDDPMSRRGVAMITPRRTRWSIALTHLAPLLFSFLSVRVGSIVFAL